MVLCQVVPLVLQVLQEPLPVVLLPVLLLGFGCASFVPSLAYLRRWRSLFASVGLVIAFVGVLDLCERWFLGIQLRKNRGPSPGGLLGH